MSEKRFRSLGLSCKSSVVFFRANSEIERLRRLQSSEMEGVQAQLRYAQLRVQSLEQELKSAKQELEQKVKFNAILSQTKKTTFSFRKKKISN